MPVEALHSWQIALLIVAETLLSIILFAAAIGILVFLARKPLRKYKFIDLAIFDGLQPWTSPRKNKIMLFITFLGKHQFLIPANLSLIFYFLFLGHQNWFSVRIGTIAISSLVLMFLLKYLFQRKRPVSPLLNAAKGLSFPSGHAIMSVTFYGLIIYIVWQTIPDRLLKNLLIITLILLILLIGYSRVYLRVHYASDVLAGFIIGLLWLSISLSVLQRIEKFSREGPVPEVALIEKKLPLANLFCQPIRR